MPIFKKSSDAPEGDLSISTPAGNVEVPASGTVEVDASLAVELRLVPSVVETEEKAEAPKTSKENK